jgi:hypothetical protein
MAFSFDVELRDADQAIAKAKAEAAKNGGSFSGDLSSGSFAAKKSFATLKGCYTITGKTAKITITEKPFFVDEETVKKEVRKFFG